VSAPEPNPDPRAPARQLLATVATVAQGQLECAIFLWFNYGNPSAIHTLAAAANGCYHVLGKGHKGMPTMVEAWIKSLPEKQQIAARRAQNFFKHGPHRNDAKDVLFKPEHAELLLLDCVISHEKLFCKRTPLMTCFFKRCAFENPHLTAHVNLARRKQGRQDLIIEQAANTDRMQFLDRELDALNAAVAAGLGVPLHDPPP
jgi:hypothetical protein